MAKKGKEKIAKATKKVVAKAEETLEEVHDTTKEKIHEGIEDIKQGAAKVSKKVGAAAIQAEHELEEVAKKAKKYLDTKAAQDLEEFGVKASEKIDVIADGVEQMGEGLESIADGFFPNDQLEPGTRFGIAYTEEVSRLFILRWLRWIIEGPIVAVWGVWYFVLTVTHWLVMFLHGKRSRNLRDRQVRFWRHMIKWKAYVNGLTDRRPSIIEG